MEFTVTKRGGRKLLYKGYAYTVDKKKENIIYWKCEERGKCGARIKTINDEVQYNPPPHTHPPDASKNVIHKTIQQIKARTTDTKEVTTTSVFPSEAASSLPKKENLSRMLRRQREIFETNETGSSNKQLYQHKKKQPPSSSTTVLILGNARAPSPPAKIPKMQTFTKEFQEENLKMKKNCQENNFIDRQSIGHVSKMAEKPQETPVKDCVIEKPENVPHPVQRTTLQISIPIAQPKSTEIPQPQGKKIFILADHQKNVMSSLALLWKSGKLCDAGIGNGLSTVMVHKVVLSAVCPKLLSVFGADMLSQKFLQINLPQEVSTEALDAFADYMYNGILDLDPNILQQLKIIAKQLDMKEFEQLCDSQLPNTTHQQTTSAANTFFASKPMMGNVSMSQYVTTKSVQPSRIELSLPKENKTTVFEHESKVALLDNSKDINSSGSFVSRVKTEPVDLEESRYHQQNELYSSTPVSMNSQTPNTMLNFKDVSTPEFVLPLPDTTHSKATTNETHGTSSKLKSNAFESSLVSNLSRVSCTEDKICSQSNLLKNYPSKPQNRTITSSSGGNIVTSGSNKGVYPVRLFIAGRDILQLSSEHL